MTAVAIDYQPRTAFAGLHNRSQRWAALVAHRRAGKTVACVGELVTRALYTSKQAARYAYLAPFYGQAKAVAWDYLKRITAPLNPRVMESELAVTLPAGQRIRLYGADNPDALRGIYLDGVVLDEYADMAPSVWGAVIRPLLADRKGWAAFIGTPKGHNAFWDIVQHARQSDDWYELTLRASQSGLLAKDELADARRTMSEDQYAAEFECSFDAAIQGAFYGAELRRLEECDRLVTGLYDPQLPVTTAWDLGYSDDTAVWFAQIHRGEVRLIDYQAWAGEDVPAIAAAISAKPYRYADHWLPQDAMPKTLASGGRSILEQLWALGIKGRIAPRLSVQDGIQATRLMLPQCWFDRDGCGDGVEALKQYRREYDEDRKVYRDKPLHDWTSHAADAFRMLAVAYREQAPAPTRQAKPKHLEDWTWNDWAKAAGARR